MYKDILPLLCDPYDDSDLELHNEEIRDGEIWAGILRSQTGREYPILEGIPRFNSKSETSQEKKTKVDFGNEWHHFNEFDNFMSSENLFKSFIYPLDEQDFQGKTIVECGCGAGRWLRIAERWKAKQIIGIDYSSSVEVSKRLCRGFKNIDILQASLFHLPLKKNLFDIVYSVGVLHHLKDSKEGFKNISKLVKKDGKIAIWVYSLEGARLYLAITYLLRKIGPKMGHVPSLVLSYIIGIPLRILVLYINPVLRKMGIKIPLSDYMNNILKGLDFKNFCGIIYDQLTPSIANYYSKEDVKKIIDSSRQDYKYLDFALREGNGWRAVLKRR